MYTQNERIRVGVLDEHDLMRDGLVSLIANSDGFACAGAWSTATETLSSLDEAAPDVLIVDSRLTGQSAFQLVRTLVKSSSRPRIIMTVDCSDERCVILNQQSFGAGRKPLSLDGKVCVDPDDCLQTAMKLGADGVIRKQCSFARLAEVIRAVAAGQPWIEPATALRLARQYLATIHVEGAPAEGACRKLTMREQQIMSLIARGHSNKEIALDLHLGYSTVKNHVSSILSKLTLQDRTQIALYAVESRDTST
jgi:DNA-binding NarL/FixJ family response regulator